MMAKSAIESAEPAISSGRFALSSHLVLLHVVKAHPNQI
jgi:hypothetical protein